MFDTETEESVAPAIPKQVVVPCSIASGKLEFLSAKVALPSAMAAEEGKYTLRLPTNAVSVGGDIQTVFDCDEQVNGQRLLHVVCGDKVLFVIDNDSAKQYAKGDKIGISVDFKMISLEKDGETVVPQLQSENVLTGKVAKQKVQVTVEGKKKKELVYSFNICETDFNCSKTVAQRLVAGGGQNVFNKELEFVFSPYQVSVSDSGIPAKAVRTLDYGKEKFAECLVGEKCVYVAVEQEICDKDVYLNLNADEISVFEPEHGIRLI